jgi:hypothetical protein
LKIIVAICFLLLATASAARADEVLPLIPDYSLEMSMADGQRSSGPYTRSILHHNGWTRTQDSDKGSHSDVITYEHAAKNLRLVAGWTSHEDFILFGVTQTSETRKSTARMVDTKADLVQSGERCRWWEKVWEAGSSRDLSCMTHDGIEIAEKFLTVEQSLILEKSVMEEKEVSKENRLVKLDRRPVAEKEVLPPAKLFDANYWFRPIRDRRKPTAMSADFEVDMVEKDTKVRLLRHYPWQSREVRSKDGTYSLMVWNEHEEQGIWFTASKGERQLRAARAPRGLPEPFIEFRTGQVDTGRRGYVLGQTCKWFDMMAGAVDVGEELCLTDKGVPLKHVVSSYWNEDHEYTTVRYKIRPVDMKEIMPPKDMLDPAKWGFPVSD